MFKKVDTCAAEFKSFTPYMYSTYQRNFSINTECEANPSDRKKIIILGGGPNRIGQGIEFDYCCCQASFSLKEAGFETIMVNCNPETVSTDYDTSDRLYFEPLIQEFVQNIILKEKSKGNLLGVIAQFGGQTPIKLAKFLYQNKLINAKKGLTLIWPAYWTHTHKGQISNKNEKYIATGWYSDDKIYSSKAQNFFDSLAKNNPNVKVQIFNE